jgi:hypothetical protein
MAFNEADLHNILALIEHGFKSGVVTSSDHAKLLLMLQSKTQAHLPKPEVDNGDDIPGSD